MIRTVKVICEDLMQDGLLLRYRGEDGLAGSEGMFLACTFWLVACLARQGNKTLAARIFKRACASANDLGLFAEEYSTWRASGATTGRASTATTSRASATTTGGASAAKTGRPSGETTGRVLGAKTSRASGAKTWRSSGAGRQGGEMLGNFPQGLTHLSHIGAALSLLNVRHPRG
jgi:GH15 family glucan-1,4-alpha-glucosidase